MEISYKLKRSRRARGIRLAVYTDGRVVVTSPYWVGQNVVEKFFGEKEEWVREKIEFFKKKNLGGNILGENRRKFTKKDYRENKEKARALVHERVEFYAKKYGFVFNKISIKNQKTRWGSCSKRGNLNFSYKIVFLTPKQQDYIIVHELCHLKQFNHSSRFWALVEEILPDYLEVKKELRNYLL